MKHVKKIFAFALTLVMALAVALPAFAQTKALGTADEDNATITIKNPAKGETYYIYKLFDATVGETPEEEGAEPKIAYQGTIPSSLNTFFEYVKNADGTVVTNYVKLKSGVDNNALFTALQGWTESEGVSPINFETSDGSALSFTGLPYGYYVVTTTHGVDEENDVKSAITVDSTRPDAEIYDKNVTTVDAEKVSDKDSYSIGETITFTATFDTTNWLGKEENAKQVVKYKIEDTLPEYLTNVTVTSIKVDGNAITTQQFSDKTITIDWATGTHNNYTNLYKTGAVLEIVYTAKLTSTVNINSANTNTVKITPIVDSGETPTPWSESWQDDAVITTYGAALKKTDGSKALKGAKFTIKGLVVEEVKVNNVVEPGVYRVVSYSNADDADESAKLSTNDDGKLYIIGLAENVTLVATETDAPDGYNKLTGTVNLPAQVLSQTLYETSGTRYYDSNDNLVSESSQATTTKTVDKNYTMLDGNAVEVVNNAGNEMPSTGGIGTTIFYIVGGVMVAGAAIFLLTKRRMAAE